MARATCGPSIRATLEEAVEENRRSRIFLGVHWQLDQDMGGELGQDIADSIVRCFPQKAG